jgi:hypothetical protein
MIDIGSLAGSAKHPYPVTQVGRKSAPGGRVI